ncbi:uncharacterized protein LOC121811348 isoform X1 [Salvia splendens]|uniref:uncharacterized protein LOC121811348 isoform X1 n=1 Tax=Salvia splendens TaxID=180675 RepID=UPI001C259CF2|nr:uncharacterized protein LOC121811348 isoform X1 [Salvia splendens]XP_042068122.1 uncharacterized protein LOC121811348 isoform X1 [Salvia splendens]XP_042068123.1 uncharacterized protein LOC121811348 isoform X1 [Salvia splendens]
MSKQVMQSMNDSTGKSRETMQSYQPGWMAHWMRTPSNATKDQRLDDGASGGKDTDLLSRGDHMKMEASRSAKYPRTMGGDAESCRMSLKGLGAEEPCSAKIKNGNPDDARRLSIDHSLGYDEASSCKGGVQLSSGALAAEGKSSREYRFISEGVLKKPVEWVKPHVSVNERSSSASTPSQERFVGPPTHTSPYHDVERYKFDKGKAVMGLSISRPAIVPNTQVPDIIRQEHSQKHSQSADVIWDNQHRLKPGQGWFQRMQQITSLPPNQCIAPEKNEQKASRYDCYPFQNLQSGVHETMRICTTVDSIEATPEGFPMFSQTTRSLLITKKNDVNVSEETGAFRRLIARINGNSSNDPFPGQANSGVKLQTISSSNSEGHGNVGDIGVGTSKAASKNESSAETDTLVLDNFKEERLNSCVNSMQSTKIPNSDNNLSPWVNAASAREVRRCWASSRLPPVASSSEDVPTSSRTQSLEMDMPMFQAEQPELKSTPSSRWVKRLKNSSDCSSRGTKTLNMAESLSHEKKRAFFRSILNKGFVSSEPTPKQHHGKEMFLSEGSGNSSKEDEHLSPNLPSKSKELLLSHFWIKRWLCNGSQVPREKPETPVVCAPQVLKSSAYDLQKKQFPSIAAIAVMGKSMAGFQSCELEKRGSLTVWKTNTS